MRSVPFALLLAAGLSLPVAAQFITPDDNQVETPQDPDNSPSLFEEGAKLMLRGLMKEMEPALDEMGRALSELEPAMRDMARMIDDIRNYDKPRMLPNGDILIPRRPGAPPPPLRPDSAAPPTGEIEL